MAITTVLQTGRSGMMAAKAGISTAGHNISNVNTEGFSRQRVLQTSQDPGNIKGTEGQVGKGTLISRIERVNDSYIDKQIRNASREFAGFEEKGILLQQTEDIFNEMGGEGLNRLVSGFFNEFRKLANDPNNEAVRHSVREATGAMTNDFKRLRKEVEEVRNHIDSKIEGYVHEANSLMDEIKDLNIRIKGTEISGASANDLMDKRDLALKKLAAFCELSMHKDNNGNVTVDVAGVGPVVSGPVTSKFATERSPADDQGKSAGRLDIKSEANATSKVTHGLKGGRLGALVEVRDKILGDVISRLDDLAFNISNAVNDVHSQGFTREGMQGSHFFKQLSQKDRAAELMDLSESIHADVNNIAAAAEPDAPGDNRIAIAISGLQGSPLMGDGKVTADDWYNSIVSEVGVAAARNKSALNQTKDIMNQMGKLREQISGVSIDEETTQLMEYQHIFDASAKVIQVADEMLKTVLELKR